MRIICHECSQRRKAAQGTAYDGPVHFNVFGIKRITGDQAISFVSNGGCVMGSAPLERIYFMMSRNNEKRRLNGPNSQS